MTTRVKGLLAVLAAVMLAGSYIVLPEPAMASDQTVADSVQLATQAAPVTPVSGQREVPYTAAAALVLTAFSVAYIGFRRNVDDRNEDDDAVTEITVPHPEMIEVHRISTVSGKHIADSREGVKVETLRVRAHNIALVRGNSD